MNASGLSTPTAGGLAGARGTRLNASEGHRLTSCSDRARSCRWTWNLLDLVVPVNFCRRFRLRSSASVFFTPGMWPTSRLRPLAWAQEATFCRKRQRGKAVVNSLLTEACVGLLSLRVGKQKRRLEQPVAA